LIQAGLKFTVVPSRFDESTVPMTTPSAYARTLAESKAGEVAQQHPDSWIIGADTIVVINGVILGKPGNRSEARAMLQRLSGQTHQVVTGYCIRCKDRGRFFSDAITTDVTFKVLSEAEIEWYTGTQEPFDKAGAYAIQGLGTFLVKAVSGSYTNVVGLPVCEVIEILIREGVVGF
jgi:septum formation protein